MDGDGRDLCGLDAVTLAGLLRTAQVSAREVVAAHIAQVERVDGTVNALVTRTFERALERARAADDALAAGAAPGLLHGLPVAHKDLAETAGVRTTYGSPLFADHVPDADALHVARMRVAGAICLGKTNTPEFGAGSQTFNTLFGATRNPFDPTRTAGGSSGGAAAALAAREVALADGSDMGGSLRNPASFCNVVGLRPSAGLVPSWPVADTWSPLAVVGPMGRTVADTALLLAALSGPDPRVPLALAAPAGPPEPLTDPAGLPALLSGDLRGVRVAVSPDLGGLPVDRRVRDALAGAPAVFERLGATVLDTEPDLSGADEVFRVERAFAYALAFETLVADHRDRVKDTVVWNVEQGLAQTSADLRRATRLRTALTARLAGFFADVDVLACPVSQVPPFDVETEWVTEIDGVPMPTYIDWMASACRISVTGCPAVSVPAGFTGDGLPVGLQLVGRPRGDWDLLRVAHAFERAAGA
ncbi:MAG TPA: amidase, partial [Mycobacteriales bacterium]|nr:amidase [Mycobacteriales bacterium]